MGLTHHPEVFHLLHPLARGGERLSRKALAAIAQECAGGGMASGRSEAVSTQRCAAYAVATAAAEEPSRPYDNFSDLWTALRQALALFDADGRRPALPARQAEMDASMPLMGELPCAPWPPAQCH